VHDLLLHRQEVGELLGRRLGEVGFAPQLGAQEAVGLLESEVRRLNEVAEEYGQVNNARRVTRCRLTL